MLYVKLLREDGFCDAVRLKGRDALELYAWNSPSWELNSLAIASKLNLLRAKSFIILAILKPRKAWNLHTQSKPALVAVLAAFT